MVELLEGLLKLSLAIFMVGNLLEMGLRLELGQALAGLRNVRFVFYSLLWGFVLCPALAVLLTELTPLEPSHVTGMLLLGMTPTAPFLPMMVDRARGDLAYAAVLMLLASVGTVIYMPLAIPVLVPGLHTDAWSIAKPLLIFLIVPLAAGLAIQRRAAPFAGRIQPIVKKATVIDTLLMLVLCALVYGEAFIGAIGSYAFGTQIVFYSVTAFASYGLSFGLPRQQKSVLALGMITRNLGAALAPLIAVPDVGQGAMVMVVIGVPMQIIFSLLAAIWFGRRAMVGEARPAPDAAQMEPSRE